MDKSKDMWWGPLTLLMLLAIIGYGWYALTHERPLNIIDVIVTALLLRMSTMVDYRYGSSKGSKEKTELLTKNVDTNEKPE
jgi:uncharacterized membrane protein